MTNNFDSYSDQKLVEGLLSNDHDIVEYFFYVKCSGMFAYVICNIFNGNVNRNELISEFYLYLSKDNWKKVRQFDYRSKLMTWTSVVAIRFFQKKRDVLIENESEESLCFRMKEETTTQIEVLERQIDLRAAIKLMNNERYKQVIYYLDLKEKKPELVAKDMGINTANLYNIHHRALLQLKVILNKENRYVKI